jgi:hypothetical protein
MDAVTTVTPQEVSRAATELGRMKRALRSWLNYRLTSDNALAGIAPSGRTLKSDAKISIAETRDLNVEQRLATQLHALLSETMKGQRLPDPNLRNNPHAAVELAQIALGERATAQGLSGLGPVPWPVVIVAGVLLTITTAIKTNADLAAEKERLACIKAGACTDYGFWLKAAAIVGLGWFAWTKMGVREYVEGRRMRRTK